MESVNHEDRQYIGLAVVSELREGAIPMLTKLDSRLEPSGEILKPSRPGLDSQTIRISGVGNQAFVLFCFVFLTSPSGCQGQPCLKGNSLCFAPGPWPVHAGESIHPPLRGIRLSFSVFLARTAHRIALQQGDNPLLNSSDIHQNSCLYSFFSSPRTPLSSKTKSQVLVTQRSRVVRKKRPNT